MRIYTREEVEAKAQDRLSTTGGEGSMVWEGVMTTDIPRFIPSCNADVPQVKLTKN